MSGSASSFSASTTASSRKRAAPGSQSLLAAAAAADQPGLFSQPPAASALKRARKDLLPQHAFSGQTRAQLEARRWASLSPAQRCFTDGLTLAFSYLSLFELIPAARACRSWQKSAEKASVSGVEVRDVVRDGSAKGGLDGSARLLSLVSSPFRRHVHALTHSVASTKQTTLPGPPSWILSELRQLQRLPQLRRISGMSVELVSLRDQLSTAQTTQKRQQSAQTHSVTLSQRSASDVRQSAEASHRPLIPDSARLGCTRPLLLF
jgi:hypothetical protein